MRGQERERRKTLLYVSGARGRIANTERRKQHDAKRKRGAANAETHMFIARTTIKALHRVINMGTC